MGGDDATSSNEDRQRGCLSVGSGAPSSSRLERRLLMKSRCTLVLPGELRRAEDAAWPECPRSERKRPRSGRHRRRRRWRRDDGVPRQGSTLVDVGGTIKHYEIIRTLGQGGMGDRVLGPGHEARAPRRDQAAAQSTAGRDRALPGRGACHGELPAREHRGDPRGGRAPWTPVPGARVHQGLDAEPVAGPARAPRRARGARPARGRRGRWRPAWWSS